MNTNRLSDSLCGALNAQITQEAHSAQIYLSFASWARAQGYDGISNFLFKHANEERNHMMKFLEYVLERGAKVSIQAIPAPPADPSSAYDAFEKAFAQEVDNTTQIYKIVKMSLQEEDWITWNFLQWFVKEQNEEETLIMGMLDKFKISGEPKTADEILYVIDRDLKSASGEAELAREKSTENP